MAKYDKTSHDLADELERAAKALRNLPAVPLSGERQNALLQRRNATKVADGDDIAQYQDLGGLAERLPAMDVATAEPEIRALAVNEARQLAKILGLRVASKATKDETVGLLLSQLYEVPAGQERLRTFHERNRG